PLEPRQPRKHEPFAGWRDAPAAGAAAFRARQGTSTGVGRPGGYVGCRGGSSRTPVAVAEPMIEGGDLRRLAGQQLAVDVELHRRIVVPARRPGRHEGP